MQFTPRTLVATSILAASTMILAGCSATDTETDTAPLIVVTSNILGDATSQIVGEEAEVVTLMPPGADPHEYQPSTKDIAALHEADLVFAIGLGFEEALESQLHAAETSGVTVIEVAEEVSPLDISDLYGAAMRDEDHDHEAHEHEGHEHGDHDDHDHGPTDPHFWHDPERMITAVDVIAEHLVDLEGTDSDLINTQAAAYIEELRALDAELSALYAQIPEEDRVLVTQHRVLGYLAQRYGFETAGSIIPAVSTHAQLSAAELAEIAHTIEESGVKAVFIDVTQPDALANTAIAETGREIPLVPLYTESLAAAGETGDTYIGMMRLNAERIVEALTV